MTGFSADWLALREPHDTRARNAVVRDAVAATFSGRAPLHIIDLGCGTGSTLRALAPRLRGSQSWTLIDADPALLARATTQPLPSNVTATVVPFDLNRDLVVAIDGHVDLITASALLDLVSDAWLDRFARSAAARSIPIYAALSYDGRAWLDPEDSFDTDIINAVNAHQRTDKGFGPALGPAAAEVAIARFEQLGYRVIQGTSDWIIGPDAPDMLTAVLNGWVRAAREMDVLSATGITNWLARRIADVAGGRASLGVGHVDFFAVPSTTR
jgi:hypothetical protein